MALSRHFQRLFLVVLVVMLSTGLLVAAEGRYQPQQDRAYNEAYSGAYLSRIAFPLGGIGAGMVCLDGTGSLSHVSVRNEMEFYNAPCMFAAICVKKQGGNVAKVLEGQVPGWKIFGARGTGNGAAGQSYGFPRFLNARFKARFPFATVTLTDEDVPLGVTVTGWSPFIPTEADLSSLPMVALEYTFTNSTGKAIEAVFSYNTKNFMASGGGDRVLPIKNGFILEQPGTQDNPERQGSFAFFTDNDRTVVDHGWFKGGWWDPMTLAWKNVSTGRLMDNPPMKSSVTGASLFVPLTIPAGKSETVRLHMCWHVPNTRLRYGRDGLPTGPAFGYGPSHGTATGARPTPQQAVSGYLGKGLVNSYDPLGDGLTGTLTSPVIKLDRPYMHFLVGGGNKPTSACVQLLVNGKVVRTATGRDKETLEWTTWDLKDLKGKKAQLKIIDNDTGPWGHINADHFILSESRQPTGGKAGDAKVIADFEGADYGDWIAEGPPKSACCPDDQCEEVPTYHSPWYTAWFSNIQAVAASWRQSYDDLRQKSVLFREAFYDTTLPPEVVEAVAANLTILKSPTVQRQPGGRLWCWEGCSDSNGCCAGSCTHVWNYAQAFCHLFPSLERSLRKTEFNESQSAEGHQTFRSALPIRPVAHGFHAASDGQLGGIMKVYRDWRISGDTAWLKKIWPQVRHSLDYCIRAWDPRHKGVLEEPHHNTYDIEYWGPDGHCSSFYLGALQAAAQMGEALKDDVSLYRTLLEKGKAFLKDELYNGEYFYQKIQTTGLNAKFHPLPTAGNGKGYQDVIDALNKEGPKYQYGTGCLSDGILGFWMAEVCGVGRHVMDRDKVRSNLKAIHRYNFKPDLSDHANPQRPAYAYGTEGGLLLCTWPRGGKLSLPFVYSDEVWTGIEYQVASHLMLAGMVEEGLDIVRACRDRYDGRIRNPFNEYECGHWYARAMSSYALIQGLTGVRYDAVSKTLYMRPQVGDTFKCFLSTATGFGTVGMKKGKPFFNVVYGKIPIDKVSLPMKMVPAGQILKSGKEARQ